MRTTAILVLAAILPAAAADKEEKGWKSLFNGKDFTGWKVVENPSTFTIQDGAMVAKGPRAHAFYVGPVGNHNFKNFELKVDVMTLPNSNGGIYFHTELQETDWPKKGFEVQVNNSHKDWRRTGGLYAVADNKEKAAEDGQWFTEHIIVKGDSVTIEVNGKVTSQWTQPSGWNGIENFPLRKIASGTIALQGHDPGSTIHYKNIRIKLLK